MGLYASRALLCMLLRYVRDFELETIGLKATPRRCCQPGCGRRRLRDSVLDWGHPLPPEELLVAERECSEADLVLCLGTR